MNNELYVLDPQDGIKGRTGNVVQKWYFIEMRRVYKTDDENSSQLQVNVVREKKNHKECNMKVMKKIFLSFEGIE